MCVCVEGVDCGSGGGEGDRAEVEWGVGWRDCCGDERRLGRKLGTNNDRMVSTATGTHKNCRRKPGG